MYIKFSTTVKYLYNIKQNYEEISTKMLQYICFICCIHRKHPVYALV